jgi:hypothetical protein
LNICVAGPSGADTTIVAKRTHRSWLSYALLATALAGFVLQQSALKTGVLAPAMGSSNAATLAFSVVFGLRIFDESIASGGRAAVAYAGLSLAVVGVVVLATRPSTKEDQAS